MSDYRGERLNAFDNNSLTAVTDDIFGKSEAPDTGRIVAKPTSIFEIWADPKQPRRALPLSIRMHWNGNPDDVPDMLGKMHMIAEKAAGTLFHTGDILDGKGEGINAEPFPAIAQEYLSLLRLAQSIKADGLINPITVIESDSKLLIESGERRWLAYHLLHMHFGEAWVKIPAARGNVNDSVWRQATENMARNQLNAISKARQIALLIIAARGEENYHDYADMVKGGLSDRRYYAQVADGNLHRIPKGMGERIQGAMGLSMEQLSRYRALLRPTDDEALNDILWTRADVDNWPEGHMRDVSTLPHGKVSEITNRQNWTLDDLRALREIPVDRPPSTIGGQPQQEPQRMPVRLTPTTPTESPSGLSWLDARKPSTSFVPNIDESNIEEDVDPDAPKPQPEYSEGWTEGEGGVNFRVGDKISTTAGRTGGVVLAVDGQHINVDFPGSDPWWCDAKDLFLVERPEIVVLPPRLIIPPDSHNARAYEYFRLGLLELGESETANTLEAIRNMTDQMVRAMGTADSRSQHLDSIYQQATKFDAILMELIASDLRLFEAVV